MPSDAVNRTFPPFIRWALITTAILIGSGYAFGPRAWSSSTSFDVLKSIDWFPIQAWGFCFICAGVLMMSTKLAGYAFGVILWCTWGLGLLAAATEGKLAGWGGGVWPFFAAAICGYEVYRWGQRRLIRTRAESARRQAGER